MFMICSFPPPVHGQSLVNVGMRDRAEADGLTVETLDIGPGDHDGLRYHGTRIRRVLGAARRLLLRRSGDGVYLSSESGLGVFYLFLLIAVARGRRLSLVLHHHVYSYFDTTSLLHRAAIAFAGKGCTHILLSPRMATDFRRVFGAEHDCRVLHNAIFIDPDLRAGTTPPATASAVLTVGFIGRLDREKGFDDFLALAARLADEPGFRFVVAGDHETTPLAKELDALATRLGDRLELRGFVVDDAKRRFYADIDVLVFPSRYRNEASPMVCYEALAMGVPIYVTRVGAVDDIVVEGAGGVLDRDGTLVARLAHRLERLRDDPATRQALQQEATARFRTLEARAEVEIAQYHRLCSPLASDRTGPPSGGELQSRALVDA